VLLQGAAKLTALRLSMGGQSKARGAGLQASRSSHSEPLCTCRHRVNSKCSPEAAGGRGVRISCVARMPCCAQRKKAVRFPERPQTYVPGG